MSYEPTNWKTGDIVTSAKLNKLENGVANSGGVMVVRFTANVTGNKAVLTLDKTWNEIHTAQKSGIYVVLLNWSSEDTTEYIDYDSIPTYINSNSELDRRYIAGGYSAQTPDDYPYKEVENEEPPR